MDETTTEADFPAEIRQEEYSKSHRLVSGGRFVFRNNMGGSDGVEVDIYIIHAP
jgi:hypothetical protein